MKNNYTPKMNYYWMMGDNRHNSQDSRYWGFSMLPILVIRSLFLIFIKSDSDKIVKRGFKPPNEYVLP